MVGGFITWHVSSKKTVSVTHNLSLCWSLDFVVLSFVVVMDLKDRPV